MLSSMTVKERAVYAVFLIGGVLGLAYIGAKQMRPQPSIIIENPPQVVQPSSVSTFSEPTPTNVKLQIHVVGAVNKPGVVVVDRSSRVQDAIRLAGGAKPNADLEQLNLAAKLIDGSQLTVPSKQSPTATVAESDSPYAPSKSSKSAYASKKASSKGTPALASISLNTASKSDLDWLPGIGPSTAQKILDYRQQTGGFSSINELLQVKGIGAKKLAAMRKYLKL